MSKSSEQQLHILLFPIMAHGHMIPMIDIARMFAREGVKATIVTTPLNATLFAKVVESDKQKGFDISIAIIKFPYAESGLPEGCENISSATSKEMTQKFFKISGLFREPLEQILENHRPDCVIADMSFTWATEVASKFGIPRLTFHGFSCFALCVLNSLMSYEPHKGITSDSETFIVPGLPDQVELTNQNLPDFVKGGSEEPRVKQMKQMLEEDAKSSGVIINSFQELEPAYFEHYRNVIGNKAWHIGPVSLCNKDIQDKSRRGNLTSIDQHACLKWLDSQAPESVIYICFGSIFRPSTTQLAEMAMGFEASGQHFIWVVRVEATLPEGFEKRVEGKGLIIRGWAPQTLILDHDAVGGFVTHCGWNSVLESVSAGVPMITWPLFSEQFFNEKMVTEILRIGVAVGAKGWSEWVENKQIAVGKANIENAIRQLMAGDNAVDMRTRAKALKQQALRAYQDGGTSSCDLKDLLHELKSKHT